MYVSVIEKLDRQINGLYDFLKDVVTTEGQSDLYYAILSNISMFEKKREKIQHLMNQSNPSEHWVMDEEGYPVFVFYTVKVNGKEHPKEFRINETLPNGNKLEFKTIEQSNPYFV